MVDKTAKKATAKKKKPTVKQRKNSGNVTNLQKWKKGHSGNPAGRPKKEDCLTSLLREEIDKIDPEDKGKRTWRELIVVATMRLAIKGNAAALKEVWERLDGKVTDKLDINPGGESNNAKLLAEILSRKELKELHDRLERAVKT